MRLFLTALTVLSILVMAQSVLAVTSAPSTRDLGLQVEFENLAGTAAPAAAPVAEAASIGGAPEPMATFLLLTGISGLAAAGNRPSRARE